MTSDILKQPVHKILQEKAAWEDTKPNFHHPYESQTLEKKVVKEKPEPKQSFLSQERTKRKLKVLYNSIVIPQNKQPPCHTCKASPCCKSYIVPILKDEYESGIYGDYAVKLTKESLQALRSQRTLSFNLNPAPGEDVAYVLEGVVGEACPFLGADNKCTIYEYRPKTCREYTCVDDKRITQELRDGTAHPITASIKRNDL